MSDTKKRKYHITITNNETGEVLHDADACSIIASVNEGPRTCALSMNSGGPLTLAETLGSAEGVVREIKSKYPEVGTLAMLHEFMRKRKQSEETETEETKNEDFE